VTADAGSVRRPAVAGSFYPADPAELRRAVTAALRSATESNPSAAAPPAPKALVAPHAGYVYSGAVAASAYARVAGRAGIERVAVLGPAHRWPVTAVAAPSVDAFATPLGALAIDTAARDDLAGRRRVVISDDAHRGEHSLEVQLPFLQVALGDVKILPLAVGQVRPDAVVAVLDELWDDPATLIVISTDLSHYHDQLTASAIDRETASAIVARRADAVTHDRACGADALRGLLVTARQRDCRVELLDLRTSADTAGPPDHVVGYGAFAVT
jgi:AmmeMemoRadiSam system protein B